MYLIGGLEDQIILYIWAQVSNSFFSISDSGIETFYVYQRLFNNYLTPWTSNQPVMWTVYSLLGSIFKGGLANIFFVLTMFLVFAISYKYFKRYAYPVIFSLLFTFSTYMLTHMGRHVALVQIWLIPLLFMAIEDKKAGMKKNIKIATTLSLAMMISNYLGFFLILAYCVYTLVSLFQVNFKKEKIFNILKHSITTMSFAAVLLSPLVLPFAKGIYFPEKVSNSRLARAKKSVSDFTTFSSRPWYFITPPIKNPITGKLGFAILNKFESTGYFLADDYFSDEHQSNYYGVVFLTLLTCLTYFVIKKEGNNKNDVINNQGRKDIILYLVVALILFLFMMPPFITLSGLTIYTPGWLIYKFFPIFRVTARLTVVVHFLLLALFSKLLLRLKDGNYFKPRLVNVVMFILLIVTFVETYIPVDIYKGSVSDVYKYLGGEHGEQSIIAVYPYNKTKESFLWLHVHKQLILNPRGYRNAELGYESETLTRSIPSEEGLLRLKELNATYLVVFENDEREFFEQTDLLELEEEFEDSKVYKIL